jgi:hypothetical protein
VRWTFICPPNISLFMLSFDQNYYYNLIGTIVVIWMILIWLYYSFNYVYFHMIVLGKLLKCWKNHGFTVLAVPAQINIHIASRFESPDFKRIARDAVMLSFLFSLTCATCCLQAVCKHEFVSA